MKNLFWFLLLVQLVFPYILQADGKGFTRYEANVVTPDQRALIFFKDGNETLVVETKFVTSTAPSAKPANPKNSDPSGSDSKDIDSDFAWIIPLPSVPEKVEEIHPKLLAGVQRKFRPELIRDVPEYWIIYLVIFSFVFIFWVLWLFNMGCASFFLAVLFPIAVGIALLPASGGTISSMFGTISGKLSVAGANVTVHDRSAIGSYETVTISSKESDALLKWLDAEGFKTPTDISSVVEQYVKADWIFFAARLRKDGGMATEFIPHPLAFRFKCKEAVYPLKLTGVGNGNCRINLYVVGETRAVSRFFEVLSCRRLEENSDDFVFGVSHSKNSVKLPIKESRSFLFSEAKRNFGGKVTVVTKLEANLTESQMGEDAKIKWEEFSPKREITYSYDAAVTMGLNFGVPLPLVFIVFVLFKSGMEMKIRFRVALVGVFLGTLVLAGVFFQLPKSDFTAKSTFFLSSKLNDND